MSLGVVTGIADRMAALVMAAIAWRPPCSTSASGHPAISGRAGTAKRALFWDFLKNLSLGAGFLLIVIGTNGSGLQPFLAHPLASSHPYASSPEHP